MLTGIVKILLFISSYAPLYLLLLFANMGFENVRDIYNRQVYLQAWNANSGFMICMIILVLAALFTVAGFGAIKSNTTLACKVEDCNNQNNEVLNYFITYLIPILSMDITDFSSVWINIFIFFIIGVLYVKSEIIHLNPLMLLMGYKIFGISNNMVISKKNLFEIKEFIAEHGYIEVRHVCGNIYVEKPFA